MSSGIQSPSRTIIVTGMHRSGTSFVAGLLHPAGSTDAFEDTEVRELQRAMLHVAVGDARGVADWGWPESGDLRRDVFAHFADGARRLIARRQDAHAVWGWSDPRTSLLLPFWQTLLPAMEAVLVFRAPWEVEASLRRLGLAEDLAPDYPLRIWEQYNQGLLDFYRSAPTRCTLLPIRALERNAAEAIAYLRQRLSMPGLTAPDRSSVESHLQTSPDVDHPFLETFAARHPVAWHLWEQLNLFAVLEHGASLPRDERMASNAALIPVAPVVHDRPLVSVIIPSHNDARYLPDALTSVVRAANPRTDTVIVDDGSTDVVSLAILDEAVRRGWRVVRQAHAGLSAARNSGARAAQTDFLLPLDADDELAPGFIEAALELLEVDAVDVIYADYVIAGETREHRQVPEFDADRLFVGNFIPACALIRRDAWRETGGYDETLPSHEDWDLWLALVERGRRFQRVDGLAFTYRVRPGSMLRRAEQPELFGALVRRLCGKHPGFASRHAALLSQLQESQLRLAQERTTLHQYIASLEVVNEARTRQIAALERELARAEARAEDLMRLAQAAGGG